MVGITLKLWPQDCVSRAEDKCCGPQAVTDARAVCHKLGILARAADLHALLHIDGMAGVGPVYAGPALPAVPDGEQVNFWGMRTKSVAHEGGAYEEQTFYPLAAAETMDDLDKYAWPQADWFNYSGMKARAREAGFDVHLVKPIDPQKLLELLGTIARGQGAG